MTSPREEVPDIRPSIRLNRFQGHPILMVRLCLAWHPISMVATMTKSAIQEHSGATKEDMDPTVATLRKSATEERPSANNEDKDRTVATVTKSAVPERASANIEDMDITVATVTKSAVQERSIVDDEDTDPRVNLVVNYDLPVIHRSPSEPDDEVYLHRIRRVGNFGRKGVVFNLLCGDTDDRILAKIEHHFNHFVVEVPSWKSDKDVEDAVC